MHQLVLSLFFLSGASALVYQVVWARVLTQVFGTTATAVGIVLAAFMSGLAMGSWLLGRAADRRDNPLRFYAVLELAIGLTAVATQFALDNLTPAYLALHQMTGGHSTAILAVTRFVLAFGLIMVPTCLMGATLPVLARHLVRRLDAAGADLSVAYAVNTAGAVAGTVASGFYLIGVLGIHGTVYLAAAVNLALGLLAWAASFRTSSMATGTLAVAAPKPPGTAAGEPIDETTYGLLLLGLGISGLTSFAYEIYWTRSLVFILGNSTYALSSVLTAFLTGIALGALLARLFVDRVTDPMALFGWIQLLIAVTAAAAMPALFNFMEPQAARDFLRESADDLGMLAAARFGIAILVMLVPATLIGMTFPLVGRAGLSDLRQTGRRIGLIYACNTLGNVAGALLPGFVLLAWLGIQGGTLMMAALNALVGFAILGLRLRRRGYLRRALPAAALATVFMFVLLPLELRFPSEGERPGHRVLFYRDGPSATTKVTLDPETGAKVMAVDGIVIGGNTFTEYKQLLLAHLPKLLLDDFSTELSVGLGSGMLAGESLRHANVRRLTAVEIEPGVTAGAAYFSRENHDVLADPRVRLVIDDIGNHLRTTSERYRVISADEKTALEYASNGFSYSQEYYQLLRRRLARGGIAIQWVPANLPPRQYRMVLKTFSHSFPHVLTALFMPALSDSGYNTILVGSNEEISLDATRMERALKSDPGAFAGLARYGLSSAEAILAQFAADGDSLREAVRHADVNTLEYPRYEFFSPQDYAIPGKQRVADNLEFIMTLRRQAWPTLLKRMTLPDGATEQRLKRAAAAELAFLAGYRRSLGRGPVSATEIFRQYDTALALAPWNESLHARISLHYTEIAASQVDPLSKAGFLKRALNAFETNAAAQVAYSRALEQLGKTDAALAAARRAVEIAPGLVAARRTLAELLIDGGNANEGVRHLRAARKLMETARAD